MITFQNYCDFVSLPKESTISERAAALWGITTGEAKRKSRQEAEQLFAELSRIERLPAVHHPDLPSNYGKMTFGTLADLELLQQQGDRAGELARALIHSNPDPENQDLMDKRDEILTQPAVKWVPVFLWHLKKKTSYIKGSRQFTRKDTLLAQLELQSLKLRSALAGASTPWRLTLGKIILKLNVFFQRLAKRYCP